MGLSWLRNWLSGPWLCVQSDRILKEREWLDRPSAYRAQDIRYTHCRRSLHELRLSTAIEFQGAWEMSKDESRCPLSWITVNTSMYSTKVGKKSLRHGEEWRDRAGDKFGLSLAIELADGLESFCNKIASGGMRSCEGSAFVRVEDRARTYL